MEKRIKFIWTAGFFLPAINATVFRWFSKILRNSWGWYVKMLTIPYIVSYMGRWVVWKRPKTPLHSMKMAPKLDLLKY